jgi:spermidine synthase
LIIKILSEEEEAGYSAGLVYAWGTVGSILGTFLTTFVLIPYLGSRLTLYGCFLVALLTLIGLFLLIDRRQIFIGVFILLISLVVLPAPILSQNVLLETESAYNQIRLVQKNELIYMILNSPNSTLAHSVYVKDGTLMNISLIDLFNVGAEVVAAKDILVLGMAGGASIRQFQQYFPEAKIDAVEIDPKIVDIAKEKFGISESEKLKIYIDDARPFLARTEKKYDLIEVDLFQGSPYIPFYVLTREFFEKIKGSLSNNGVMAMNIYAPAKKEILEPALATIATVFPSVYKIPISDNFLVLATERKTSIDEMKEKIKNTISAEKSDLDFVNQYALMNISEFIANKKTPVFTDDWAPVEPITYKMVKGLKL